MRQRPFEVRSRAKTVVLVYANKIETLRAKGARHVWSRARISVQGNDGTLDVKGTSAVVNDFSADATYRVITNRAIAEANSTGAVVPDASAAGRTRSAPGH